MGRVVIKQSGKTVETTCYCGAGRKKIRQSKGDCGGEDF